MSAGDFRPTRSRSLVAATTARIEHRRCGRDGDVAEGRAAAAEGEVLDATFMSRDALVDFLRRQMRGAKAKGVLFSLHMKATMMKVSDPIIFGTLCRSSSDGLREARRDPRRAGCDREQRLRRSGRASIATLPERAALAIERTSRRLSRPGPRWPWSIPIAGITNLHVPSDIIIDASMPPMIRDSGGCGMRTASFRTRRPSSPTPATPASTTPTIGTARPTARSTRPRWAACRTSD